MKCRAVIVLAAIVVGLLAPPFLPAAASHDGRSSIGTLDVCHSAAPALSLSGEMPVMTESPCSCPPLLSAHGFQTAASQFQPCTIAYPDERPPEA